MGDWLFGFTGVVAGKKEEGPIDIPGAHWLGGKGGVVFEGSDLAE